MNENIPSKKLKLGLVQMSMTDSAEANLRKAEAGVREAARRGADIVCLPELFVSPYFCNVENAGFGYAEEIPSETTKRLAELAKECSVVLVAGSLHEKLRTAEGKEVYYNTSVVFDVTGEALGNYRKTHIPHDEAFFEQFYFAPGDTGFKVFDTAKGKIAVLICYDQWYPEAARAVALLGADIVFYPTAIGNVQGLEETEGNWQEAWENVMRGHAIANGMIVAAVNRVGSESRSRFWGGSFVCNAFGKTLVRGSAEEEVIVQEVDLAHSAAVREGWRFFPNRRPEMYKIISK